MAYWFPQFFLLFHRKSSPGGLRIRSGPNPILIKSMEHPVNPRVPVHHRSASIQVIPRVPKLQNGSCTHAWVAIVLLVGVAALSIFESVKNNDNPFFREAIVIFCTQRVISVFNQPAICVCELTRQLHYKSVRKLTLI